MISFPEGVIDGGAPGLVLYGLVCILPIDSVYTSDPTRECGGCADGARDLVLVLESYNLSNILILSVHSCYTSSVHSYLRFIFTAVVLGLVLSWFELYTSRDLVLVFESYNLSNISFITVHSCYTSSVHSYLRFIFTAVVLGLVLSWFELYTSRDLMYTSRDLVFVFVFDISI